MENDIKGLEEAYDKGHEIIVASGVEGGWSEE